jgi:hypothetical protein
MLKNIHYYVRIIWFYNVFRKIKLKCGGGGYLPMWSMRRDRICLKCVYNVPDDDLIIKSKHISLDISLL